MHRGGYETRPFPFWGIARLLVIEAQKVRNTTYDSCTFSLLIPHDKSQLLVGRGWLGVYTGCIGIYKIKLKPGYRIIKWTYGVKWLRNMFIHICCKWTKIINDFLLLIYTRVIFKYKAVKWSFVWMVGNIKNLYILIIHYSAET